MSAIAKVKEHCARILDKYLPFEEAIIMITVPYCVPTELRDGTMMINRSATKRISTGIWASASGLSKAIDAYEQSPNLQDTIEQVSVLNSAAAKLVNKTSTALAQLTQESSDALGAVDERIMALQHHLDSLNTARTRFESSVATAIEFGAAMKNEARLAADTLYERDTTAPAAYTGSAVKRVDETATALTELTERSSAALGAVASQLDDLRHSLNSLSATRAKFERELAIPVKLCAFAKEEAESAAKAVTQVSTERDEASRL